jgi:hypothetical protein
VSSIQESRAIHLDDRAVSPRALLLRHKFLANSADYCLASCFTLVRSFRLLTVYFTKLSIAQPMRLFI